MLKNAVIMGNIYDPDTDCQMVLMKVSAKDWDDFQRETEEQDLPEVQPVKKRRRIYRCECGYFSDEPFYMCPTCQRTAE